MGIALVVVVLLAVSFASMSVNTLGEVRLEETPSWTTPASRDSSDVELGDFDYDGDLDLASYGEDNILVYENVNGEIRTNAIWTSAESTGLSGRVMWADIDKDNYPELVTSEGIYDNNNGALSTTATWTNLTFASTFEIGDVDLNGYVDLILGKSNRIDLYKNSAGTIDDISDWNTTEDNYPNDLALGDVDNDGFDELAVGNWLLGNPLRIYDNVAGSLNNVSVWNSTWPNDMGCVEWGDVNGDDYPELFVCTESLLSGSPNWLYTNNGGTLEDTPSWTSPLSKSSEAKFVDIEGDGDLDLVVANVPYLSGLSFISGEEVVHLNNGGVMNRDYDWVGPYNDWSDGLDVGDVDGDGYPDLVVGVDEDSYYPSLGGFPGRILIYSNLGPNEDPQIGSILFDPLVPETGQEATITVTATDADDDTMTYDFSVEAGNGTIISETDNTAVWRAPDEAGTYYINITVADGKGGSDYQVYTATVVAPPADEEPSFSLSNIWFLLILIIIIVVVVVAVVAVVVRKKRQPPIEDEYPPMEEELPPPPEEELPPPPP